MTSRQTESAGDKPAGSVLPMNKNPTNATEARPMHKRWIRSEEWYPVFELTRSEPYEGGYIELSPDELREIRRVFSDFKRIQRRLERAHDKSMQKVIAERAEAQRRERAARLAAMTPEEIAAADLAWRIREDISWGVLDKDSAYLADHGYVFVPDNHPSGKRGAWVKEDAHVMTEPTNIRA